MLPKRCGAIVVERTAQEERQRGGEFQHVELPTDVVPPAVSADDLLAVHEAVERLEAEDPQIAQLVKLRVFRRHVDYRRGRDSGPVTYQGLRTVGLRPCLVAVCHRPADGVLRNRSFATCLRASGMRPGLEHRWIGASGSPHPPSPSRR